jgi:hypothetical protein
MSRLITKPFALFVAALTIAALSLLFVGQFALAQTPKETCDSFPVGSKPAYCESLDDPAKDPVSQNGIIRKITDVVSYAAGIIGVFWIIIQAIKISTAQGNSQKVAEARNGIIYAMVGLAVVMVARTIVIFALSKL